MMDELAQTKEHAEDQTPQTAMLPAPPVGAPKMMLERSSDFRRLVATRFQLKR